MEQTDQFNETKNPSYWGSIGIAALIFAIITFAQGLIFGYMRISGSAGGIFSMVSGIVVCLIGAFGGMMAVWHYSNEYDITMKLGKGALIGFITGVAIVIISFILTKIWLLIDPDYPQKIIEAVVANLEEVDLPEGQKQEMINSTVTGIKNRFKIGWQLLVSIAVFGILNLLTGMIGVALFAKEEKDY